MSLPRKSTFLLQRQIEDHERQVAIIRTAIRAAEEEIQVHETLINLARNRELLSAVEQFVTQAGDDVGATATLASLCADRRVSLPDRANIVDSDEEATLKPLVDVRIGDWHVRTAWNEENGFITIPIGRPDLPYLLIPRADSSKETTEGS